MGRVVVQMPLFGELTPEQGWALFCDRNPEVLAELEQMALQMQANAGKASAKACFEQIRWFGRSKVVRDAGGYKLNNNWTALFARWMAERHPEVRMTIRKGRS